ncbi:hypothetical protein [uncultured Alistipes sp.]|uniref:hypothetical protein n=1 Tax=uncultured Alistipes sp. TaxID=538949 RepID=UPI002624F282|nr:hypothetical protein [uncultured Alistipes sp.]
MGECSFPLRTAREGAGEGEEKGSKKARSSVETDESLVNYRLQGFFILGFSARESKKQPGGEFIKEIFSTMRIIMICGV